LWVVVDLGLLGLYLHCENYFWLEFDERFIKENTYFVSVCGLVGIWLLIVFFATIFSTDNVGIIGSITGETSSTLTTRVLVNQ
ncbi:hypothetical protein ACFL0V_01300, partial [Nanoarchaeota archaeon]